MQIIEVSDLGVRSAFMGLRRADGELTFRLFPMIHVAEPSFYADVARRLAACDVVFLEGIKFHRGRYLLPLARAIARSPASGSSPRRMPSTCILSRTRSSGPTSRRTSSTVSGG